MTKKETIDIIRYIYGLTIKEATAYYNNADDETLSVLVSDYKAECKKAFYED